ncbi:MAG: hypothetical protein R3F59_27445 [Myxococcota bacterium]
MLNLELRGHGASRELEAGNARSFEEYVADAVRAIDVCTDAPPFVIGLASARRSRSRRPPSSRSASSMHLAGVYGFAQRNRVLRGLGRLTLLAEPACASRRCASHRVDGAISSGGSTPSPTSSATAR